MQENFLLFEVAFAEKIPPYQSERENHVYQAQKNSTIPK